MFTQGHLATGSAAKESKEDVSGLKVTSVTQKYRAGRFKGGYSLGRDQLADGFPESSDQGKWGYPSSSFRVGTPLTWTAEC